MATSTGLPASIPTNPIPQSQSPNHPSFRRQRASRACETCHARKVRCDAASLGVPCTNCVAFSIECKIPAPKRKKGGNKSKDSDSDLGEPVPSHSPPAPEDLVGYDFDRGRTADIIQDGGQHVAQSDSQPSPSDVSNTIIPHYMKPKIARAPIREAGRVGYMGESSNLSLLVEDKHSGAADVVHYPLPVVVKGAKTGAVELDSVEVDILHQRGAFLLPPRAICDELVDAYFTWVAPIVPIINKTRFMTRYRDSKNPPSLLLLQAILLAGSRVCTNKQLMDGGGSTTPAAMTFYKRAKALYDANYEEDRVTIVQALILMGWYLEGPEDVTKNVFYWTRVATVVAQGSGMHRSVEQSQLSRSDKRLWKRIWWTLFTRDRSVAVALGRPVQINTEDADVEMVTEDDFIEDEGDQPAKHQPDPVHVQFFLQYVRLCEIMGLVLSQQYSVASKGRRQNAIDLTSSDMALADWLQNCPREVYWEKPKHNFFSALLHANYYTTLCLLHRAHMPPAASDEDGLESDKGTEKAYPSRNIAFQAAGMITSIVEHLQKEQQLRCTPAFIVYSLFSAMLMHVYQMRSSVPSVVAATQERQHVCMEGLKEVSKSWLVAKMVHTLFESILGNRVLEDKLQKAPGRRHKKTRPVAAKEEGQKKRKYEEIDIGFTNGPPAPQVSFERSRPQTPAVTPSRELGHQDLSATSTMAAPQTVGANHDAFMGSSNSRGNTRPPTPFNPSFSVPPTPPDLYLTTRDPPQISWENFQPNYLFPESASMSMPPYATEQNLDPQLQMSANMLQPPMPATQQSSPRSMQSVNAGQRWQGSFGDTYSPEDSWSSGGGDQGPASIAPTTLNMEDWYQFLGIEGNQG